MWTVLILKLVPTMSDEFFDSTLNLLKNRSAQIMLKQIAKETKIPYPWICAFHQGIIKNKYNVKKGEKYLERLNQYLVSKLNPTLT